MSLCAAVVLLGTPRGQNFVAEATDEATNSVALLTLTATGNENEPVTAKLSWETFVQGTPAALELAFVLPDGSVAGSLSGSSPAFDGPLSAAPSWLSSWSSAVGVPVSLNDWPYSGAGALLFSAYAAGDFCVLDPRFLRFSADFVHPLVFFADDSPAYVPGLWRSTVGSTLDLSSWPAAPGRQYQLASDAPAVVAVQANGDLLAVSAGVATVSFEDDSGVCAIKCTVDGPADTTPAPTVDTTDAGYLEATVDVKGQQQRLRVYDPNGVLPDGTKFEASYVDGSHGDHNFFITHTDPTSDVELRHYYNLTLASGGQTLSQLDGPIELWFEAIDGIDAPDAFISRVAEGADAKLAPEVVVDADGVTWIKVLTDHFSPYALTDLLSADEKAALTQENSGPKNNVKTGDLPTQLTVAGLGMTLVLALGIMLRLITNKRKFEK